MKQRKPRKARNPRTGDRVDVAAKNVVTFQPGKEMEEQVRRFAKPVEVKKKTKKERPGSERPESHCGRGGSAGTGGCWCRRRGPWLCSIIK